MRRHVEIPDVVMDKLEIPDHLSSSNIQAHEASRVEIVSVTRPTIGIIGCGLYIEIDVSQLRVDRERPPDSGIPRVSGRSVQPRFVSGFTFPRDGMENPFLFPGSNIKGQDIAFHVRFV